MRIPAGLCLLLLFTPFFELLAQLPPNQSEQDCFGAIPICRDVYVQPNAYQGEGYDRYEINGNTSCMRIGERNSVWYTFTVQNAGSLCFTIVPADTSDDYDWAVFNLTNASCAQIRSNPNLEVSCNWDYNNGCQGRTGANGGSLLCPDQNEPCIPVLAGETFVLNVSNFNGSQSGYTLDFTQSTAQLYDNIPPELDHLELYCPGVAVVFNENVQCASVDPSDFVVTGPSGIHRVTAVNGPNCQNGGNFDRYFGLTLNPPADPAGVYRVSLVGSVLDLCGNAGTVGSESIQLPPRPDAAFIDPPDQCIGGNRFEFVYAGPTSVITFQWSFGDSTGDNGNSPIHSYSSPGIKNVTLVITDTYGCQDTSYEQVEVFPGPVARVDLPFTICQWDEFTAGNLTSGVPATRYHWDMGDGTTYTTASPVHSYDVPGTRKIVLRAESANGCPDTAGHTILVYASPEVDFWAETGVCLEDTVHFEYRSSIRDDWFADYITGWNWDFGDSTFLDDHLAPVHLYGAKGFYPVTLTVSSDKGCIGTKTQTIEIIKPDPPVLTHDSVCYGYEGKLRAEPVALGPVKWYHRLSDVDEFQPGYIYETPPVTATQTYFVEAFSPEGCVSERVPIYAYLNPVGEGRIAVSDSALERPASTTDFQLVGTVSPFVFDWDFGDNEFSNEPMPTHIYAHPGLYQIHLMVSDIFGCEYEFYKHLEVKSGVNVFAANAFSPNNDGYNDAWFLHPMGMEAVTISIFDRYGGLIVSSNDPDFKWDGSGSSGKKLPMGVYVYVLKGIDVNGEAKEKQGTITLVR